MREFPDTIDPKFSECMSGSKTELGTPWEVEPGWGQEGSWDVSLGLIAVLSRPFHVSAFVCHDVDCPLFLPSRMNHNVQYC